MSDLCSDDDDFDDLVDLSDSETESLNEVFTNYTPPAGSCLSYPTSGVLCQARITCTDAKCKSVTDQRPKLLEARESDILNLGLAVYTECEVCDNITRIDVRDRVWSCWCCGTQEGNEFNVRGGTVENNVRCEECDMPRDGGCFITWTAWKKWRGVGDELW